MFKGKIIIFVIICLLPTLNVNPSIGFPAQSANFSFTTTDDMILMLSDFQDKIIVVEWAATWCPLCHNNQATINNIFDDFTNYTNFITVYYYGSGDDLNDVKSEKGGYPWTFAYDHTNYGSTAGANNADLWILDQNLNLLYSWDYSVVPQSDLVAKLSDAIGIITSEITTSTTLTSTETLTSSTIVTENNSTITKVTTFTTTMFQTSETVLTSESKFSADSGDEILTFGLLQNPLFLGFIGFSAISSIIILFSRRG